VAKARDDEGRWRLRIGVIVLLPSTRRTGLRLPIDGEQRAVNTMRMAGEGGKKLDEGEQEAMVSLLPHIRHPSTMLRCRF